MSTSVQLGSRSVGPDHPPYVIAELGVNHDGSCEKAFQLVDAAASAGVDAIKLQLFSADNLVAPGAMLATYQQRSGATDPHEMLRGLELGVDDMARIVEHAHEQQVDAIVSVFSRELVSDAERLPWVAYKVASPDIVNQPLIQSLMKTGRPLILSTGAATMQEVRQTLEWLQGYPHVLMQCVSSYPTPDDQANLGVMMALREVDDAPLGYSDHTIGLDTGALAIAAGASVLEKHLTLDRKSVGPDHAASLEPEQLATYTAHAHRAFAMLGGSRKQVLDIEQDVRRVARQSLVTVRPLIRGHRLEGEDLTTRRGANGLSAGAYAEVLGRQITRDLAEGCPLQLDDLS